MDRVHMVRPRSQEKIVPVFLGRVGDSLAAVRACEQHGRNRVAGGMEEGWVVASCCNRTPLLKRVVKTRIICCVLRGWCANFEEDGWGYSGARGRTRRRVSEGECAKNSGK